MANIISIGTSVPSCCHKQTDILKFMQEAYELDETDRRKLAFLYKQSDIGNRYSVLPDFSETIREPVGLNKKLRTVDERMELFHQYALNLSVNAIENCIKDKINTFDITHLITVSCTGISAPGLDLQVAEVLNLGSNIFRTSINFMGCYAAIHALKLADLICHSTANSNVVIVCTELCTIHFQEEYSPDNAGSSLLFGDGSAAVLVSNKTTQKRQLKLSNFYSEICYKGKEDMSWQISSKGFLMKLSAYIPQLIQQDINALVDKAFLEAGINHKDITHWCIHPGGRKILDVIQQQLHLGNEDMSCSRKVLWEYGNMSSPTILFVLKEILDNADLTNAKVFGVAFGPGLTMETFIAEQA